MVKRVAVNSYTGIESQIVLQTKAGNCKRKAERVRRKTNQPLVRRKVESRALGVALSCFNWAR